MSSVHGNRGTGDRQRNVGGVTAPVVNKFLARNGENSSPAEINQLDPQTRTEVSSMHTDQGMKRVPPTISQEGQLSNTNTKKRIRRKVWPYYSLARGLKTTESLTKKNGLCSEKSRKRRSTPGYAMS